MARKKQKSHDFGLKHSLNYRCPICCIIPPHMLEQMGVNGTPTQREWALKTLNISAQIRGKRTSLGGMQDIPQTGEKHRTIYDAKNTQNLPGEIVRNEGDSPSEDEALKSP